MCADMWLWAKDCPVFSHWVHLFDTHMLRTAAESVSDDLIDTHTQTRSFFLSLRCPETQSHYGFSAHTHTCRGQPCSSSRELILMMWRKWWNTAVCFGSCVVVLVNTSPCCRLKPQQLLLCVEQIRPGERNYGCRICNIKYVKEHI